MDKNELIFENRRNYLLFWILILIFLLAAILTIIFYDYNSYYVTTGIYNKEEKIITFLLESSKLSYMKDAKIRIDKEDIPSDNFIVGDYVSSENKLYNSISAYFESDESLLEVVFELPKMTILQRIWKGMMK